MNRFFIIVPLIFLALTSKVWAQPGIPSAPGRRPSASQNSPSLQQLRSRLHGVARPKMSAALRSIVPGTIAKVHVTEGQLVKAGERLVTLDDRLARARLRVAEIEAARTGELQRASAQLRLSERQLDRLETAYERQAISDFELEEQRALVDQARATHTAHLEAKQLAEGQRMLAEEEFRRMTIYAPFDGVITQLHEKLGAAVDPTVPVVSIANLETLDIEMHTPVDLYGTLRPGGKVELLASAPVNDVISAEVLSISPVINSASRTFRCVLRIENSARKLPAGFSVTLNSQLKAAQTGELTQK